MIAHAYSLLRRVLFRLPPEDAHARSIWALEAGLKPNYPNNCFPRLAQSVFELEFPNPLGIAAGYDKDARVPDAVLAMGCGFAEIGTVTPRAQLGNPKPRVFRLVDDKALINRLGFNNEGHVAARGRLAKRAGRPGVVGVNIGANKDTADRVADYIAGLKAFNDVASYFMVNISSPNTPGLRDLQAPEELEHLLTRLMSARNALAAAGGPIRPLIVKLAPDLADEDLPLIVERLTAHNVSGICISNTTLRRDGLIDRDAAREAGGLSGRPLFELSTRRLAEVHRLTEGRIPLIGVGGIDSGETALAKIEAGASLLQLYTGLVYKGPGLIPEILSRLDQAVRERGKSNITELVGTKSDEWVR